MTYTYVSDHDAVRPLQEATSVSFDRTGFPQNGQLEDKTVTRNGKPVLFCELALEVRYGIYQRIYNLAV